MTGNEASPIVPSSGERIVVTDKGISQIVASNWKRVKFVEAKPLDMALVTELLDECAAVNQWANFGPLYSRLVEEYAAHMSLGPDLALTPCANGGAHAGGRCRQATAPLDRVGLQLQESGPGIFHGYADIGLR